MHVLQGWVLGPMYIQGSYMNIVRLGPMFGRRVGVRLACKCYQGWIYNSNVVINWACKYCQPTFHA
jgi:hypothetical protein